MADLVRIVDSIDASPTVLLDLNDETSWWTRSLKAPPPRLRRSVAQNSMSDGERTGAATYGSRVVELVLESRESTQDAAATQIQTLFRLLDTADGKFLQYQPQGASKPVFFVLERSDLSDLSDIVAQAAMRAFTVELKCEPFALGLKESLGPYTVNNDPAAGSNGCYFDVSGVIGDVATPVVMWDGESTSTNRYLGVAHGRTAAPGFVWAQAESLTLGTDTTNPGAGPDAAMSGTGTNNFVRTSFSTTATAAIRLTWAVPATALGQYRVLAFIRPSADPASYTLGLGVPGEATPTTETLVEFDGGGVARSVADLGLWDFSDGAPERVGYSPTAMTKDAYSLAIFAERNSGTTTLDWDAFVLIPVGGQADEAAPPSLMIVTGRTDRLLVDAVRDLAVGRSADGDPTAGAGTVFSSARVSGGFPKVVPNATSRFYVVRFDAALAAGVSLSATIAAAYWPHYLFVRPLNT